MVKIVALLGDFYHPADEAKAGLEAAISKLPNKEEVQLQYISHEEVSQALDDKPELFINARMDQLNPREEPDVSWLTERLEERIVSYAERGGCVLAWHAGVFC